MNREEIPQRATIWTLAARTMGVQVDDVRIAGLVEVTSVVPLADLKPAIEAVMRTEPNGFLPSPGAVVQAYRAISEQRGRTRQIEAPKEMQRADHLEWMADHNPDGWDDRKWKAYTERLSVDARFRALAEDTLSRRHAWVDEQMRTEIGKRKVDAGYRVRLRRQLVTEAEYHIGRPDPLEDGWIPSKEFDPIAGVARKATA